MPQNPSFPNPHKPPPSSPSSQLQSDLSTHLSHTLNNSSARRPILHHLNADTSWLLQLPRPQAATRRGGRAYFNILIDPWLSGPQSDVAGWFSKQWHVVPSAVESVEAVERLVVGIEGLARAEKESGTRERGGFGRLGGRMEKGRRSNASMTGINGCIEHSHGDEEVDQSDGSNSAARDGSYIDCVAISHEFTDHCHKETLLTVSPDVPVFATTQAASLIRSWSHFRTVITIPHFSPASADSEPPLLDWQSSSLPPLPEWIGVSRLIAPQDALDYHSALLITFNLSPSSPTASTSDSADAAESVLYTPHGIPSSALRPLSLASPPISILALLHGLHDVSLGLAQRLKLQQLNLGGMNAVTVQKALNARYWFAAHDEVKRGRGFVSFLLQRKVWGVEAAARKVVALLGEEERERERELRYEELGNGESRVLE
ncbi:hypothetical protein K402DRAFT_405135 [Aulographum hederae CBS 113979]|uniref:Uncharacterized protein n=1 Tax=Aulographum hederae CBS 113979 TaxID=1176131 RepID=A0A6G1GXM3_9PEZI|nr:hypothetical protein K402DRAFT_405135 [Aulographum hederae CBS 113979]